MGTGYVGPMAATRGEHGAVVANNESAGSHRDNACIWYSRVIATLCLEGSRVLGPMGTPAAAGGIVVRPGKRGCNGGGCVRI